jgi:hypothetical protein
MNSPVDAPAATSAAAVAYAAALDVIAAAEPDVAAAIAGELASQRQQLKLIASENYASPAVLLAMGNWLSDKYAEGTVGQRFYAGCEMVDRVESIAAGHATACSARTTPTCSRIPVSTPTWSRSGRSWPAGWRNLRCGRRASGTSTTCPQPTGSGFGGTCTHSACSAWRLTPAGT